MIIGNTNRHLLFRIGVQILRGWTPESGRAMLANRHSQTLHIKYKALGPRMGLCRIVRVLHAYAGDDGVWLRRNGLASD